MNDQNQETRVYARLRVHADCEREIRSFWESLGVSNFAIQRSLHLTVYHASRYLPGIREYSESLSLCAETSETRFMPMKPGGENPRAGQDPSRNKVGIRLTKRNGAIPQIQELRSRFYEFETSEVLGKRKPSSAWRNSFGARSFQPHVTLLGPNNGLSHDLTDVGEQFRRGIPWIEFSQFEVIVSNQKSDTK